MEAFKTIGLLRHAKSSWAQPELSDFDRPLSDRGRTAAKFMGREMRRRGLAFDLVVASPAQRVIETLQLIEQSYGAELPTRFEPRIYTASASVLLAQLQGLKASTNSVMLVGHNPALQELALLLTSERDPLRAEMQRKFPTAALALLHCTPEQWPELLPKTARSVTFIRPKVIMRDLPALG